jgi:DNA-binding response OmpR family regulator
VKALLVSEDPGVRELMSLAVGSVGRRLGPLEFIEASNGERGVAVARGAHPDIVVADEIASRAGAFHLARDLRNASTPFPGIIVILLDRPHDAWLARWSGADAWFVKPVNPFELADRIVELQTAKESA